MGLQLFIYFLWNINGWWKCFEIFLIAFVRLLWVRWRARIRTSFRPLAISKSVMHLYAVFLIFVLVGSYIYIKRHQKFCWDFDWSDLPDSQKRSSQRGIEMNWKFEVTYWMGESSFSWLNNISLFNWEGVFFI